MNKAVLGIVVAGALGLFATPVFAGHYNQQIWKFRTDNCDQVAVGSRCEFITLEVSTSTWCGSSCSASEKASTFNKSMYELQAYWSTYLAWQGFREKVTPVCSAYQNCYSVYPNGYSRDDDSVWNFGDWSTGSRADFPVREIFRVGHTKEARSEPTPPVASCYVTPTYAVDYVNAEFSDSGSYARAGRVLTSYFWQFDDGSTAYGPGPHTRFFSAPPGMTEYFVGILTVTDNYGESATTYCGVTVTSSQCDPDGRNPCIVPG